MILELRLQVRRKLLTVMTSDPCTIKEALLVKYIRPEVSLNHKGVTGTFSSALKVHGNLSNSINLILVCLPLAEDHKMQNC